MKDAWMAKLAKCINESTPGRLEEVMMARFGCVQIYGWSDLEDPPTLGAWSSEVVFDVRAEHGVLIEREQKVAVYEASGYVQLHGGSDGRAADAWIEVRAAGPVYCDVEATDQAELERVVLCRRDVDLDLKAALEEARGRAILTISSMLIRHLVKDGDRHKPRILRDAWGVDAVPGSSLALPRARGGGA